MTRQQAIDIAKSASIGYALPDDLAGAYIDEIETVLFGEAGEELKLPAAFADIYPRFATAAFAAKTCDPNYPALRELVEERINEYKAYNIRTQKPGKSHWRGLR